MRWRRVRGAAVVAAAVVLVVAFPALGGDYGKTGQGGGPKDDPEKPACDPRVECCDVPPGAAQNSQNGTTGCNSNGGNGKSSVADPIEAFTGRYRYVHVDMELNGVLPIRIVRRYDSQSRYDSPLGYGWSLDYDLRLYAYDGTDNPVVVRGMWGEREHFTDPDSDGTFTHDSEDDKKGRAGTLKKITGGYEYRYPSGHIAEFDDAGLLRKLLDPQKNYLRFKYKDDPTPLRYELKGISPYSPNQAQPGVVAQTYQLEEIREFLSGDTDTGRFVTFVYDQNTGRLDHIESFEQVGPGIVPRVVVYGHDGAGRGNLTTVTDAENIVYTYGYTDTDIHNLTSVQEGQGTALLENEYDANDRVQTQWVDQAAVDGRRWTLDYEDPDPATGERVTTVTRRIVDESGGNERLAVSSVRFNDTGHVIEEVDALGNRTTYARTDVADSAEEPPHKVTITVERNTGTIQQPQYEVYRVTTEKFDDAQNRTLREVTTTLTQGEDETVTETWTYDHDWVESYQRETTCSYACPGAGVFLTSYAFDRDGDLRPTRINKITRRIDGSTNEETTFVYDLATGQLTRVELPDVGSESVDIVRTYHAAQPHVGLLASIYVDDGNPPYHLKREFTWDAQAQLSQVKDALDNPTDFDFDNLGRLVLVKRRYYDESTMPIVTADTTTVFTYRAPNDDLDPDTELDSPANWLPGRHLTRVEVGKTTAGEGHVRYMIYDPRGRLTEVRRKDPAGPGFPLLASFVYDSDDDRVKSTDGESKPTFFAYDLMARLTSVTDPATNATTFAYDPFGNRTLVQDAKNRDTLFTYDGLSRLVEVNVDATDTGQSPLALKTKFRYDAAGNVRTVEDPNTQVTAYEYDGLSRLKSVTQPNGTDTVSYDYDERSRLRKAILARSEPAPDPGVELFYSYFPWGGLESVLHDKDHDEVRNTTPGSEERLVSYSYDLNGNILTTTDTQIQSGSLYSFTYDPQNRVDGVTVHYVPGGTDPVLDSRYDAFGNRTALHAADATSPAPTGFYQEWRFDAFNRLKEALLPGGADPTLAFGYDGRDDVTTITRKDASHADYLKTTLTWFDEGPVHTIKVEDLLPSAAQHLLLDYAQPDATLNVVGLTETRGAGGPESYVYDYDGADRLIDAQSPATFGLPADEGFSYDDAGNRDDANNPGSYDYDENNRITLSPSSPVICHDEDGNLTTKRSSGDCTTGPITDTYSWDFTNRLARYQGGGQDVTYRYDPFGRRISKQIAGGATTWYLWDGDRLLGEYDGSGARTVRYAYAGGFAPIQVAYANGSGEDVYDVHTDHLDTPRLLTDASGAPVWQSSHEAYGAAQVTSSLGSGRDFNIRLPGQYYDAETGLHYNRFRYYDPGIGRYVSADPAGKISFEGKSILGAPELVQLPGQQAFASLVRGPGGSTGFYLVGVNTYAYAYLSPVVFFDPTGLGPIRTAIVEGGCIAVGCAAGFFGGAVNTPIGCAIGGVVGFGINTAWDAFEFDDTVNDMSKGAGDLIRNRAQQAEDASNSGPSAPSAPAPGNTE